MNAFASFQKIVIGILQLSIQHKIKICSSDEQKRRMPNGITMIPFGTKYRRSERSWCVDMADALPTALRPRHPRLLNLLGAIYNSFYGFYSLQGSLDQRSINNRRIDS